MRPQKSLCLCEVGVWYLDEAVALQTAPNGGRHICCANHFRWDFTFVMNPGVYFNSPTPAVSWKSATTFDVIRSFRHQICFVVHVYRFSRLAGFLCSSGTAWWFNFSTVDISSRHLPFLASMFIIFFEGEAVFIVPECNGNRRRLRYDILFDLCFALLLQKCTILPDTLCP